METCSICSEHPTGVFCGTCKNGICSQCSVSMHRARVQKLLNPTQITEGIYDALNSIHSPLVEHAIKSFCDGASVWDYQAISTNIFTNAFGPHQNNDAFVLCCELLETVGQLHNSHGPGVINCPFCRQGLDAPAVTGRILNSLPQCTGVGGGYDLAEAIHDMGGGGVDDGDVGPFLPTRLF